MISKEKSQTCGKDVSTTVSMTGRISEIVAAPIFGLHQNFLEYFNGVMTLREVTEEHATKTYEDSTEICKSTVYVQSGGEVGLPECLN